MALHPEVVWAQRSDKVFVTIELPDAKDVTQSLDPEGKLLFSAKAGPENKAYEASLELFDKIDVEASKAVTSMRHTSFMIVKTESKWWPRLLKASGRAPAFLKVDWDKWIDEDEEEENAGKMDMDFMKQFQGAGGFGGMGDGGFGEEPEEEEEDEDLADLEK